MHFNCDKLSFYYNNILNLNFVYISFLIRFVCPQPKNCWLMFPIYTYYYLSAALLALIVFKSILYIGSTSKHHLSNWFFFNANALYNSRSGRSRKLKVLQNRLTLLILVIAVADIVAMFLF